MLLHEVAQRKDFYLKNIREIHHHEMYLTERPSAHMIICNLRVQLRPEVLPPIARRPMSTYNVCRSSNE